VTVANASSFDLWPGVIGCCNHLLGKSCTQFQHRNGSLAKTFRRSPAYFFFQFGKQSRNQPRLARRNRALASVTMI
jgi:hypothetical protein